MKDSGHFAVLEKEAGCYCNVLVRGGKSQYCVGCITESLMIFALYLCSSICKFTEILLGMSQNF